MSNPSCLGPRPPISPSDAEQTPPRRRTGSPDSPRFAASQQPGPNGSRVVKKRRSLPRLGNLKLVLESLEIDASSGADSDSTPTPQIVAVQKEVASDTRPSSPISISATSVTSTASKLFETNLTYITPDSTPPTPMLKVKSSPAQPKRRRVAPRLDHKARSVPNLQASIEVRPQIELLGDPIQHVKQSFISPRQVSDKYPESVSSGSLTANDEAALGFLLKDVQYRPSSRSTPKGSGTPSTTLTAPEKNHEIKGQRPLWSSIYQQVSAMLEADLIEHPKDVSTTASVAESAYLITPTKLNVQRHHDSSYAVRGLSPTERIKAQIQDEEVLSRAEPVVIIGDDVGTKIEMARERARIYAEEVQQIKALTKLAKLESLQQKLKCESPTSKTVHIFVDMSNIDISFQNLASMKQVRNPTHPNRPLELSFEHLQVILERHRSPLVETRVVAGSVKTLAQKSDSMQRKLHLQEAEYLGYTVNVLVRVPSVVTRKSYRFKSNRGSSIGHLRRGYDSNRMTTSDDSSSEGHDNNPYIIQKNSEQGVDELLHLLILQCITDCPETPGVIVLATGDANAAEFSKGFAYYITRALEYGWQVELVTWKHSTSAEWRKAPFTDKYRSQFRIIYLDEFFDELHADWI